ncbi:flagellar export protein FliJ [Eubacterium xylanophilum]|uniref:flagellar export protein FliJ n=1 Tax=Eubacterium xylanophilum TaxID=39497 RepID=UPI00047A4EC6|nr:flagellar export protein FliJ [Eubacterium xylanophilum]
MARFNFSMQNILDMKEKLEEQAKNEYAEANMRLMDEQEKEAALAKRQEQAEIRLAQMLHEQLAVMEIRRREEAVEILKMYKKQQQLAVKRCEKEVEAARERLQLAMQERKMYEKLREKAFEKFLKEELDKEQKEVDERNSYQYGTAAQTSN